MVKFWKTLSLGLMLALSAPAYGGELGTVDVYSEVESSPYRLAERLPTDGASSLILPEVYTKLGVWAEDRFIFPGAPEDTEVLLAGDKIDDKPIQTIQLQLSSTATRTLEFSQIQAKPRLVLHFKAPPAGVDDKTVTSTYVRIYIGKRLLDRLRITTDSQWVRKEYPLNSAQFLKQKLTLTLSMSSDSEKSMLVILGYLKS